MSREVDKAEALRSELVRALVDETGMREQMALPIAESLMCYLQRTYPGERLYIPLPTREYPVDRIAADLRRGMTTTEVCRDYSLSRRTLYRLFPDGLPSPHAPSRAVTGG